MCWYCWNRRHVRRACRAGAPVAAQTGFPTKRVEPFRFLSDATWNELAGRYTEDQLREIVLIVGAYTQLAMFQNSLGAQLPPGF